MSFDWNTPIWCGDNLESHKLMTMTINGTNMLQFIITKEANISTTMKWVQSNKRSDKMTNRDTTNERTKWKYRKKNTKKQNQLPELNITQSMWRHNWIKIAERRWKKRAHTRASAYVWAKWCNRMSVKRDEERNKERKRTT